MSGSNRNQIGRISNSNLTRKASVLRAAVGAGVAVGVFGLMPGAALGTSGNWTGATDNTWQGANWSATPAPGSTTFNFSQGETATFNTTGSNVVSIDSGRNIKFIAFTTAASTYTIGTNLGNSLLLATGGNISTAVASQFETIAAPLILEPASATAAGGYQFVSTGGTGLTASTLNFTGPISGGSTNAGISVTLSGSSNNTTGSVISGDVSNAIGSSLSVSKANASTWSLTGTNNSFTGGLNVNQGVLQVATISNIGTSSSIGAGGGINSITASGGTGTLRITGAGGTTDRAITIVRSGSGSGSGLVIDSQGSAPVTFSGGITSSASAAASTTSFNTLTLTGPNTGTNTISGNINDFDVTLNNERLLAVAKSGAGAWSLSGNNSYTGGTTVSAGTLNLQSSTALGTGSLTFTGNATFDNTSGNAFTRSVSGITLNASPTFTGSSSLNLGTGAVGLGSASGGTRTITVSANTLSVGGILSGTNTTPTQQFTKAGGGTLAINGANNSTYTGLTTVSGGTLLVNNAHTTAGAYSVAAGATLGGAGSITTAGNVGVAGSTPASTAWKLSPGNATTPGTLTMDLGSGVLNIAGAVNGAASQDLLFDLITPASSDRVLISNASSTLNIGTGILNFDDFVFTPGTGFGPGTYTLFDTGATITGTLGSSLTGVINGIPSTIQFANGGQDIVLVVPEPASFAVIGLAGIGLLSRRRARSSR